MTPSSELIALIARIDQLRADLIQPEQDVFQAEAKAMQIIRELEREHGATFSWQSGACVLRLAKVRASATAGKQAVLLNWQSAALRRIARLEDAA